jgi:hypothetical protein
MPPITSGFRILPVMLAIGVTGCGGGGFSGLSLSGSSTSDPALARPAAPPVNMAGRWMLAQPGRGQCAMTFRSTSPDAAEGTIAPEGGCPGKFFTSRRWTYDSGGLVIRDHNSQPLAQLSSEGGIGRFDGKSTTGDAITLTR